MKAPNSLRVVLTSLGFLLLTNSAQALSILVDFGSSATQTNHISITGGTDPSNFWNNVTSVTPAAVPLMLVDTTNASTGISLQITSRFSGINTNGAIDASAPYNSAATRDSFYGNTEEFSGQSNPNPSFTLSGLDPSSTYSFRFYASRTGAGDVRTTDYFVAGGISGVATLDVANNVSNTASVVGITPDTFGQIQISLAAASTNNNSNHFIYLGALEIVAVPEPSSAGLLLAGGVAALGIRRRRLS